VIEASGRPTPGATRRWVASAGRSAATGSAVKPRHLWQMNRAPPSSKRTFQNEVLPEKIASRPPPSTNASIRSRWPAVQYSLVADQDHHAVAGQHVRLAVEIGRRSGSRAPDPGLRPGGEGGAPTCAGSPRRCRRAKASRRLASCGRPAHGRSSKPRGRRLTRRGTSGGGAISICGNGRRVESNTDGALHGGRQVGAAAHQRGDVAIGVGAAEVVVGVVGVGRQHQHTPWRAATAPSRRRSDGSPRRPHSVNWMS